LLSSFDKEITSLDELNENELAKLNDIVAETVAVV